MNCHHCGQESEPGNNFCPGCGVRLQLSCPSCQTSYAPGSQFCSRCGRNLAWAGSPPPGTISAGSPPVFLCPRCHQGNTPGADYCFACGMPFDDVRPNARPLPARDEFSLSRPVESWPRLLAAFIDGLVVALMWIPLPDSQSILLLLWAIYNTAFIAIWATSPGKRAFGLYVARSDGSKVGVGRALARSLAAVVSAFTVIGFLMIVFRQDKRGLHDLICDTVVVRRRR